MNYITLALCSAILTSFVIIIVKYISKHVLDDSDAFLFWTYVSSLPFIIFIPLIKGFSFDLSFIAPIFIQSFLLTSGLYFFSRGVYSVDASVIGPLFQLQSGFIVILAAFILKEHHPPIIYLYLTLLIIGAMFVSVTDHTKLKGLLQKGVILIILMQFLHASSNIAAGFALRHTTNWQVVFYSFLFNALFVTIYAFIKRIRVRYSFKKIRWFFLRAFLLICSTTFLYKAFETNISISAAIGLLASPLVFLISLSCAKLYPELLEKQSRHTYLIRTVGVIIILLAAWQINTHK